jgi:hypothetical protein
MGFGIYPRLSHLGHGGYHPEQAAYLEGYNRDERSHRVKIME